MPNLQIISKPNREKRCRYDCQQYNEFSFKKMEVMESASFHSMTPLDLPPCAAGLMWDVEENSCLPYMDDISDVEIRAPVPDTRCAYGYYFQPIFKQCTRKKYQVTKGSGRLRKWWEAARDKSTISPNVHRPIPSRGPPPGYTGKYWKYHNFGRDVTYP